MDWMEQSAPREERASHSPLYYACGLWRHGGEVWEGRTSASLSWKTHGKYGLIAYDPVLAPLDGHVSDRVVWSSHVKGR